MLVVLFSSNVFADEKKYIENAKEQAERADYVLKIFDHDGMPSYTMWTNAKFAGVLEAKASELCGTKGYILHREENVSTTIRKWHIRCK